VVVVHLLKQAMATNQKFCTIACSNIKQKRSNYDFIVALHSSGKEGFLTISALYKLFISVCYLAGRVITRVTDIAVTVSFFNRTFSTMVTSLAWQCSEKFKYVHHK